MLKGHVQIDLHNHNSGFTERYEQDNLVTNAISKILPNYLYWGNLSGRAHFSPLATTLLGGLMLFDDALTESADNIHFPADAHLVGFAGQFLNSDSPISGSYNSIESGATATGHTAVWDFTTSQCNGTIESLARTLNLKGPNWTSDINQPFLTSDGGHYSRSIDHYSSGNEMPLYWKNGYVYGNNGRNILKRKCLCPPFKLNDVHSFPSSYTTEKTITYPALYSTLSLYQLTPNADGYAYLIQAQGNSSGDGQAKYFSVKLSDLSFDVSDVTTINLPSCQVLGGSETSFINMGKAYICANDKKSIYIVDLANPNNIIEAEVPDNLTVFMANGRQVHRPIRSGGFIFMCTDGSSYYPVIIYPDGTAKRSYTNAGMGENPQCRYLHDENLVTHLYQNANGSHSYYKQCITPNYLGTICNLASPVTKTASQSMKITYTLTDAQEQ